MLALVMILLLLLFVSYITHYVPLNQIICSGVL